MQPVKVYKSDSSIRIDATLLGYEDGGSWKRGNQSFIFRFNDHSVEVVFVDHCQRAVGARVFSGASVQF